MAERTLFVSWVATAKHWDPYRQNLTQTPVSFGDTTVTITREGRHPPDIDADEVRRIREGIASKLPAPSNVTLLSLFELN